MTTLRHIREEVQVEMAKQLFYFCTPEQRQQVMDFMFSIMNTTVFDEAVNIAEECIAVKDRIDAQLREARKTKKSLA